MIVALILSAAIGADYSQFRDPVAGSDRVPTEWNVESGENVAWTADLDGRGLSSPLVIGDRVVVTSSGGLDQERLIIDCFDDKTGDRLWRRQFWATGRTASHNKTANAAPTPASDGERVFAFWSSGDLICVDLDGNLQWVRGLQLDYPNASNSLGMSSSLVTAGDVVVAMCEADAQSVTVGLDVATGEDVWALEDRPKQANWTSPVLAEFGETTAVLLQSSKGVEAIDITTGERIWNFSDGASTIPSSVVYQSTAIIPSDGLTAVTMATGETAWQNSRLSVATASPTVLGDRVYILNRAGVVAAVDAKSGDRQWQLRLSGPFSASPVVAGDRLYFVNEEGLVQVVAPQPDDGEIIAESDLGDTILATPAVRGDALYFRSDTTLWKIAATAGE